MQIKEQLSLIFGVPGKPFLISLKDKKAFVAELRPGLEGINIVSPELLKNKVTPVVICDNMMAFCMRQGLVKDVHIFYKNLNKSEAVCRTGSLIAALCAKAHNIPVHLYPTGQKTNKKADLRKICGKSVTKSSIKTYVPMYEEVPLELVSLNV